jgi:hypothetical protein
MVSDQTAPALAGLMKNGIHFTNTHSMFATITMVNAASLTTGHKAHGSKFPRPLRPLVYWPMLEEDRAKGIPSC